MGFLESKCFFDFTRSKRAYDGSF